MINKFYEKGMWMLLGSIISLIILEIRFRNPLLRKELILLMESGMNGYFSMFIILDVFLLIIIGGFYIYNKKKKERDE